MVQAGVGMRWPQWSREEGEQAGGIHEVRYCHAEDHFLFVFGVHVMTSWQRDLPYSVDFFRNVNACSILSARCPAPSLLVMDENPPLTAGERTTDTLLDKAGTPLNFLPHPSSPHSGESADHRVNGVGDLLGKKHVG